MILNSNKKVVIYFILVFLLFLFLAPALISHIDTPIIHDYLDYAENYDTALCLEYLENGKLYEGQPKCMEGVTVYLGNYAIKSVFGSGTLGIRIGFALVHLIAYLFLWLIIRKETKAYYILPLIFYIFLIYLPIASYGFGSLLAALFLLLGTYFLYFRPKYAIVSGIAFVFAMFSKLIVLPALVLISIYFLYKNKKKTIYLSLSFISAFLLLLAIFPNILGYTVLVGAIGAKDVSYLTAMRNFIAYFSFDMINTEFLLYLILFLSLVFFIDLYLYDKKFDIFSFIVLASSFAIIFAEGRCPSCWVNFSYFSFLAFYRFFIPIFPFFIISFFRFNNKLSLIIPKKYLKLIPMVILILLFYLPFKSVYLTYEVNSLAEIVSYPVSFIPEQKGKILADADRLGKYGYQYDYEIDILPTLKKGRIYDSHNAKMLEQLGYVENASRWGDEYYNRYSQESWKYVEKIVDGEYPLIHIGGLGTQTQISMLLNYLAINYPANKSASYTYPYCTVIISTLNDGHPKSNSLLYFLFAEKSECGLRNEVGEYYKRNFDKICKMDELVANLRLNNIIYINEVLSHPNVMKDDIMTNTDDINIDISEYPKCLSEKHLLFSYRDKGVLSKKDIMVIFSLIGAISIIIFFYSIYSMKNSKKVMIIFILSALLILSPLYYYTIQENKINPHKKEMFLSYLFAQEGNPALYSNAEFFIREGDYQRMLDEIKMEPENREEITLRFMSKEAMRYNISFVT